ncbi:MAG: type IX secretion system sortase PorU [Prevotella sp.]|nr:type IX secretion system sortase PorU [Prevotella sp.]
MKSRMLLTLFLILTTIRCGAQEFFNLTADDVRIDSVLPVFTHSIPLKGNFSDSTYEVKIVYPEFIDMAEQDVRKYRRITDKVLPEMPLVNSYVAVERKRGMLDVSFVPLVMQGKKYKKLVSFKLDITAKPKEKARKTSRAGENTVGNTERYADNSVLATGTWAKIRVPRTGIYELTNELVKRAGFTDISKVKIYGYGGNRQPETLTAQYLADTDDLKEVPTCNVNGKRVFFAYGPVYFNGVPNTENNDGERVINPYSDYGYYFLTENSNEPLTIEQETLQNNAIASGFYNNVLYEIDDFAWFHGGRNLYDSKQISAGEPRSYTLTMLKAADRKDTEEQVLVKIVISADAASVAEVMLNGEKLCELSTAELRQYAYASIASAMVTVNSNVEKFDFTISHKSGGNIRLDYIWLYRETAMPLPDIASTTLPSPEYVGKVENQNRHADNAADMIIIIPTSKNVLSQAERLKELHERHDGMSVRIVTANELFNEFSSGTPDATAYKRYMKMLYDRADNADDAPKHLLLFGDCAWDNRMNSAAWRSYSADDFLLSYQGENSLSSTENYVTDDFFALLDDDEAIEQRVNNTSRFLGKLDVAVGRIPARNNNDAKTVVDKIEAYINNDNPGTWQNTIVIMGDDGDSNSHMRQAENIAKSIEENHPSYDVKRIMWDAYKMEVSSTGNTYPEVTKLIKEYLADGALIMNYTGHGAPYTLSHEKVVSAPDFINAKSKHLPLLVAASCDIMPYDTQEEQIGEGALLNKNGGAIAVFAAARTVYSTQNQYINNSFMKYVLETANGKVTMGEATRLAKNSLVDTQSGGSPLDATANKLQYALLGDPALCLAIPTLQAVIDSIGDKAATNDRNILKAGSVVKISGHIEREGYEMSDFNGLATIVIQDVVQHIVCNLNPSAVGSTGDDIPFTFDMRPNNIFTGTGNVRNGKFSFSFAVPKDISYSDETGRILVYAVSDDNNMTASGYNEALAFNGTEVNSTDSIGPSIFCYLNNERFNNGDVVNATPYFVAQIYDDDGVNASGSGIGHDLQLIIDGDMQKTYNLNNYFTYDFGSYQSGTVGFSIPALEPGNHKLLFRAWDVLNNPSVAELSFKVEKGVRPQLIDISCTRNPATTSTQFCIVSDRINTEMDIIIDVFDISGRHLWSHAESAMPDANGVFIDWDLSMSSGGKLSTGVYLYRVRARAEGSSYASKAKKLIILNNKS